MIVYVWDAFRWCHEDRINSLENLWGTGYMRVRVSRNATDTDIQNHLAAFFGNLQHTKAAA